VDPDRHAYHVVGLGNPGDRYARTRHNVGFCVVDELSRRWRSCLVAEPANRYGWASFAGVRVALVQPLMFMNRSGEALSQLVPPVSAEAMIVVHDDLDLACSAVRVKLGGGIGGHRGLESLRTIFGSEFARVRVGIGRPVARAEVVDYVLSDFDEPQKVLMDRAVIRAADAVESILQEGAIVAMNHFNSRQAPTTLMPC